MGRIDDRDGAGLGLVVHDSGRRQHGLDEGLELIDVRRAQGPEAMLPLFAWQLVELLLAQGIDRVALMVKRKTVHESQLFHLLHRIASIEMAADVEFRTRDFGIVKILFAGALGQHLEEVIDGGFPD